MLELKMGFVFLNETDLEGEVVTRIGLRLRFSDSITTRGIRTSRSLTKVTSSRSRLSETTLGCRSSRSRNTTIGRSWCAISRSAHGLRCSHTPSTDGVKPTTLLFACIDVEAHSVFLTYLYVELVETIFKDCIFQGFPVLLETPERGSSATMILPVISM